MDDNIASTTDSVDGMNSEEWLSDTENVELDPIKFKDYYDIRESDGVFT